MTKFYNRASETAKRRVLRNSPTRHEALLWEQLKGKQLMGFKFRRQYSVGPYIVDFYCPEFKLAIELDGSVHAKRDNPQYDAERQCYIEAFGICFMRFSNSSIEEDVDVVLNTISQHVADKSTEPGIGA